MGEWSQTEEKPHSQPKYAKQFMIPGLNILQPQQIIEAQELLFPLLRLSILKEWFTFTKNLLKSVNLQ